MDEQYLKNYQLIVLNGKNTAKLIEKFTKYYDEKSGKRYFFEKDLKYPKNVHDLHNDLPFLPESMKIQKCNKFLCNLHVKKNYVAHKNFKTRIKLWIDI